MRIFGSVVDLIGNTPLLELKRYAKKRGLQARIFAKLESFNPAGSVKDRTAYAMITDAEERGLLKEGSVIVEATSGNTGIGIACVAACKGYRTIIVMPETMSAERRKILKAYGAELVLTEGKAGMAGAIARAEELLKTIPTSVSLGQFTNPANPLVHFRTTGAEIWNDTNGKVDIFVAGVGTGGTLSGAGKYLKSQNGAIKVIAVEPFGSSVLSGGNAGAHGLQGIGAGFLPDTLDTGVYDEVIAIKDEDAFDACRAIAREEGILAGISSGAALRAATEAAMRAGNAGKNIVVIFPDTGERYLSSGVFEE